MRRCDTRILVVLVMSAITSIAGAQPVSEIPEPPPLAPTLEQIGRETKSLYDSVRPGVMRVQLPPTYWPAREAGNDQLEEKWKSRLDPEVRQKIEDAQRSSATSGGNLAVRAQITSVTQPTTQPRLAVSSRPDGGVELIPFTGMSVPYDAEVPDLTLKVIGLLIDEQGYILVPLYIEAGAMGQEPLRVTSAVPGTGSTTATFVGSDRQTNLTVLKLQSSIGRPVQLTGERPEEGSLVIVLSPAGDSGKLAIWTGGQQDRGIVVTMEGGVAGFARHGQFLSGAFARPVIDQLIQFGKVKRATLGVLVEETETLDGRRAMRVERVAPDSPAGKVGLQRNDFILSMAGAPVNDLPSFAAAIAARDGETELQVLRGEQLFAVTVTLHPN